MALIGSEALQWTEEQKQQALTRFREANLQLLNPTINQLLFSPVLVSASCRMAVWVGNLRRD